MCAASSPSDIDLGCGFQLAFASGTRSMRARVVFISWSNSGSIVAAIGMKRSADWVSVIEDLGGGKYHPGASIGKHLKIR